MNSVSMSTMVLSVPLGEKHPDVQNIPWQITTAETIVEKLTSPRIVRGYNYAQGFYGVILRGGTGIGKMYITCETIRRMAILKAIRMPEGSNCPFPFVWIIPSNILIETQRVLKKYGVAHLVHVMTYGAFRGKNNPYVEWVTVVKNNEPDIVPQWKKEWLPAVVILDECQGIRNPDTSTAKVALDLAKNRLVKVILASATPGQRICEMRAAMVLCGPVTEYNSLPLTNETYSFVASSLCANNKNIYDYSPKNMRNLREALDEWYVEPKNVRFQFPAHTTLTEVDITPAKRDMYNEAYKEYLRKIWELQKRTGPVGIMARWVALGKFQEKAELLRADILAEKAVYRVTKCGNQVIIGSKYRNTLRAIWLHLTKKCGVAPDNISFVVGGQTSDKRQVNVDAFQAGATQYMLLTMGAGGVGLSLHHDRADKSSLQRYIILPPTYAAIQFVQVLGRGHRLTSRSSTKQEVVWIRNTVESEKVLPKARAKLRCLNSAVTAQEHWGSMLEPDGEEFDKNSDGDDMVEAEFVVTKKEREEEKKGKTKGTKTEVEETDVEEGFEEITGEGLSNES